MKTLALVFHVAGAAIAASAPLYPTLPLKGLLVQGFRATHPVTLDGGTLDGCKGSGSGGATYHECGLKDAELKVDVAGTEHIVDLTRVYVFEYSGSATLPPEMEMEYEGQYEGTLPDGTQFKAELFINLLRKGSKPELLSGNFSGLMVGNGAILLNWPPDAAKP